MVRPVWKCTRDLSGRLPIGHYRANVRAKKEKRKMVRKGGGPAWRLAHHPFNQHARAARLYEVVFAKKEEAPAGCRQAS